VSVCVCVCLCKFYDDEKDDEDDDDHNDDDEFSISTPALLINLSNKFHENASICHVESQK
jgi:hypothetical protein